MAIMRIRHILLGAASLLAVAGQPAMPAEVNALTPAEEAAGFKLLFDGATTSGWQLMRPEAAKGNWTVKDGALIPEDRPRELMTEEEYGDFELLFDWKIGPAGNSGVMYRVQLGFHPPTSGPEYQLLDDERHKVRGIPNKRTAAAYDIYPPTQDATKPAGQWNTGRILVEGNHVEHWLNGAKALDYELHSPDWQARVRKSKFAKHSHYGRAGRGRIVLQHHGSPIWFRNLKIRPIGE